MPPKGKQQPASQDPPPRSDSELDDHDTEIGQLQDQVRTLTQTISQVQQNTQDMFTQMMAQLRASTTPGPTQNLRPTIEVGTPFTDNTSTLRAYSKKRGDPTALSDGKDPTFISWRIQLRAKLRDNADHFPTKQSVMDYIFGCTSGTAQGHLETRHDEDSPMRFTSREDMFALLATVFTNPNKVQDARYEYSRLTMKTTENFQDFQTTFLRLAGDGQVPQQDYRMDLYYKLPVSLQRLVLPTLDDLVTYERLAARCLTLDTGLRRIRETENGQREARKQSQRTAGTGTNSGTRPVTEQQRTLPEPTRGGTPRGGSSREGTPRPKPTCTNCGKEGHWPKDCWSPKRAESSPRIAEVEETDESGLSLGKDDA